MLGLFVIESRSNVSDKDMVKSAPSTSDTIKAFKGPNNDDLRWDYGLSKSEAHSTSVLKRLPQAS